jgi:beta-lactamase class D
MQRLPLQCRNLWEQVEFILQLIQQQLFLSSHTIRSIQVSLTVVSIMTLNT